MIFGEMWRLNICLTFAVRGLAIWQWEFEKAGASKQFWEGFGYTRLHWIILTGTPEMKKWVCRFAGCARIIVVSNNNQKRPSGLLKFEIDHVPRDEAFTWGIDRAIKLFHFEKGRVMRAPAHDGYSQRIGLELSDFGQTAGRARIY